MPCLALLRRLVICLLGLCLSGIGPSVLAAAPQALNVGSEEETRSAAEHHAARTASPRAGESRAQAARPASALPTEYATAIRRSGAEPAAPRTLRTLQVRIQV